jgi:hypothetical protein
MGRENIGSLLVDHFKSQHLYFDDDFSTLVDKVITDEKNVVVLSLFKGKLSRL